MNEDPEEIITTHLEMRFLFIYAASAIRLRRKDVEKAIELFKKGNLKALQKLSVKDARQRALTA
jgi:hypothetical protein